MLSRRFSAFACSCRSASSASRRWLGEHREQGEDDGAADRDVQGQHRGREPAGWRRLDRADELARDTRSDKHDEIGHVPASPRPDVAEHERRERGEDPPQADAAGVEKSAERDHRQRRRQQDGDLAHPEQPREVARAREHGDPTEQHAEVHQRHHADRRPEGEIERPPQRGDGQDQHRDQDQQRLPGAQVFVVARVCTDKGQARVCATRGRSDPVQETHLREERVEAGAQLGAVVVPVERVQRVRRHDVLGKAAAVPDVERGDDRTAGVVLDRDCARVAVVVVDEMREGTMPSSRSPSERSRETTRARYAFWLQSSGARASSPARKATTSSGRAVAAPCARRTPSRRSAVQRGARCSGIRGPSSSWTSRRACRSPTTPGSRSRRRRCPARRRSPSTASAPGAARRGPWRRRGREVAERCLEPGCGDHVVGLERSSPCHVVPCARIRYPPS